MPTRDGDDKGELAWGSIALSAVNVMRASIESFGLVK